jgi:hypothetical protein
VVNTDFRWWRVYRRCYCYTEGLRSKAGNKVLPNKSAPSGQSLKRKEVSDNQVEFIKETFNDTKFRVKRGEIKWQILLNKEVV